MNSEGTTIDNATVLIRRVGDKAFVTWKYVEFPSYEKDGGVRHVFWVDVRKREIVGDGFVRE